MATVHIIGAGISGLAAATQLAAAHVPVKVYESGTAAGGRARHDQLHVFSGAAKELQRFIRRIEAKDHFTRVAINTPSLRAPLMDYAQFLGTAARPDGTRAERMLPSESPLHDAMLVPLSRLGLTNPAERATTRQMRQLLLSRLRPGAMKFYAPKASFKEALIAPACQALEYHGGSIYFGQALKSLDLIGNSVASLTFARKKLMLEPDDVIILATPGYVTKTFVDGMDAPTMQHCAITFHFATEHREAVNSQRVLANAPADMVRYADGLISASIRLAGHAWNGDEEALAKRIWKSLRSMHAYLGTMPEYEAWREKRAGHVPLTEKLSVPNLPQRCLLAGDWLDASMPGTLESAAKSGHDAARLALALVGDKKMPTQSDFYLN